MAPVGVILPTASAPPLFSANQRFPSGPEAIPSGPAFGVSPVLYSVIVGAATRCRRTGSDGKQDDKTGD